MVFKVLLQTLKNIIKLTEVFTMSFTNPDAPVSGGSWLANTYSSFQNTTPVYAVGYTPANPFSAQDATRRTMINNPAYGNMMPLPIQNQSPSSQQIMPYSSYPPSTSTPATSGLNQLAISTQATGNTAAMSQNNPWATQPTTNQFVPTNITPVSEYANVPNYMGFGAVTPTVQTTDLFSSATAWDKKNGSPWPQPQGLVPQYPVINWNAYSNTPSVNGYYVPATESVPQPNYPSNYNTTPITSDWSTICETNFKQQF